MARQKHKIFPDEIAEKYDKERERILKKYHSLFQQMILNLPNYPLINHNNKNSRTRVAIRKLKVLLMRRLEKQLIAGKTNAIRVWHKNQKRFTGP